MTMTEEDTERVLQSIEDDEEGGIRIGDIYIPPAPKPICSNEVGRPRLVITKIVNNNFKSYAGEQVLGPFHKCFTSIIGPNGSGKSNVIDSMLFVFGYRASKIRSKKISVLLHDSENHRNVTSCAVAVHFTEIIDKDGDNFEEVPDSSFVITRKAFRDNSSFYELNDRRVPFKDVANLLKRHNVDLRNNRFLILQGEVEQIAMMKTKAQTEHETGMLEYLEDIIGTTRFKEPLVKLFDLTETLTAERAEKLNRVNIVQLQKNELEEPVKKAIQFLKVENSITSIQNQQYQKYIFDQKLLKKEKEAKLVVILQEQAEINNTLAEITQKIHTNEQLIKNGTKESQKLNSRKDLLTATFKNIEAKDESLQADMSQTNVRRKKTNLIIEEEGRKLSDLKQVPENNAKDITICEKKIIKMSAEKDALEEEKVTLLDSLATVTRTLQEKREVLETELLNLNKDVGETKSAFNLAESELQLYMRTETEEAAKLERLQEAYQIVKTQLSERQMQMKDLKAKIPAAEKEYYEKQQELKRVESETKRACEQMESTRSHLEEARSAMQSARSRGRVLDALNTLHGNGKLPGFLGRLGDLGAIDIKYDVAVSTACGPLDNIVVDDADTASNCIDYMKVKGIGRGTFIALDKQEHLRPQANTKIPTPENVPRLFDLIRFKDERIKTAFFYGLRNTLVAENLDQATRIAYGAKRYRVVTLRGDLIEVVGTMSGGGNIVAHGRMGQKVMVNTALDMTPEKLQSMERNVADLAHKTQLLKQQRSTMEQQVEHMTTHLREMKMAMQKCSIEVQSLADQEPSLKSQLKAQELKVKNVHCDPKQIKTLNTQLEQKKKAFTVASAAAEKIQVQVNAISEEITDKTAGKLKPLQKKLTTLTQAIDKLKTERTKLQVAIKTAERNTQRTTEKIATLKQDVAEMEESIHAMAAQRKEIETDATQILQTLEQIEERLREHDGKFVDVHNEVEELTEEMNTLKGRKITIDHKCSTIQKTISEYETSIPHWKAKLKPLKLHTLPKILDIVDETQDTKLKDYTDEELKDVNSEELQLKVTIQQDRLKSCKPNLKVIEEYQSVQDVFILRVNELDAVTEKRDNMRKSHDDLLKKRHDEFIQGYHIINTKLKEMYQMITLGGDAELELVDTLDPFSEGVLFNVRPPKKSWKSISNLSGGEKTLSSLALVFALHYYKPSPLYVMDEIDAALDFKNVSIVGHYIKEQTKNAQFIIISLRSNMFELADRLVGIYKTFNCTKSTTINPGLYQSAPPAIVSPTSYTVPPPEPEPMDVDVPESSPPTMSYVNGIAA